jgi:hypothetical protein
LWLESLWFESLRLASSNVRRQWVDGEPDLKNGATELTEESKKRPLGRTSVPSVSSGAPFLKSGPSKLPICL